MSPVQAGDRRARFRELHAGERLFVMPNPWDVGSARLLEAAGFEALATTSAGFAWSLGKLDRGVSRVDLVEHVAASRPRQLPLNVDSERCYPEDPGGVAETVALLADAGAAGFSIEDYDPATGRIDDVERASERVATAAEAAHGLGSPLVLTGRAENHIRGVDDLDDTIARLVAYRDAGADVVYAPGLASIDQIEAVVEAVGVPVNVLALPGGPSVAELEAVRRASRVDGRLARPGSLRRADGRSARAARRRHLTLCGERRLERRAGCGVCARALNTCDSASGRHRCRVLVSQTGYAAGTAQFAFCARRPERLTKTAVATAARRTMMPPTRSPSPMRKMNGALAAAAISASTFAEPSAFMTTIDQSPSSAGQSRVCVPIPLLDAAQIETSPGGAGTVSPGRGV